MKIKWIGSAFVCLAFTFGCGGDDPPDGSGVDPTLELGTLEAAEASDLCEYGADLVTPRTVDCDTEDVVITDDPEDCLDLLDLFGPECEATVGEMEACLEDLATMTDDEICDDEFLPASCIVIVDDATCG